MRPLAACVVFLSTLSATAWSAPSSGPKGMVGFRRFSPLNAGLIAVVEVTKVEGEGDGHARVPLSGKAGSPLSAVGATRVSVPTLVQIRLQEVLLGNLEAGIGQTVNVAADMAGCELAAKLESRGVPYWCRFSHVGRRLLLLCDDSSSNLGELVGPDHCEMAFDGERNLSDTRALLSLRDSNDRFGSGLHLAAAKPDTVGSWFAIFLESAAP